MINIIFNFTNLILIQIYLIKNKKFFLVETQKRKKISFKKKSEIILGGQTWQIYQEEIFNKQIKIIFDYIK